MSIDSTKKENLYKIAWAFLRAHNVKVTHTSLWKALGSAEAEMNLANLSDTFKRWNIETIAIRIRQDQLNIVDLPAIAHLIESPIAECFVMIEDIQTEHIKYFTSDNGYILEPIEVFNQKWDGVLFLALPDTKSGEKYYEQIKKQEKLTKIQTIIPYSILVLCLLCGLLQPMPKSNLLLSFVKIMGIAISISILFEYSGKGNSILHKICKFNSQTDCQQVLNSPAAKIWGRFGMADIGLVYFVSGLLILLLSIYSHTQSLVLPLMGWINVLAMPYTLFSIYYQGLIIKKWCPLCVGIQILLWVECIINWTWLNEPFNISVNSIGLIVTSFSAVLSLWIITKPFVDIKKKVEDLTRDVASFRENRDLFKMLLEAGSSYPMHYGQKEIMLGNPEAPVTLTMVSGAYCSPCAKAHKTVETLLAENTDELRVIVRFAVGTSSEVDLRTKVAKHFLGLVSQKSEQLADALCFWYKTKNIDQLQQHFPLNQTIDVSDELERLVNWNYEVNIEYTPTFFINGYAMPRQFSLEDLQFHIKHLSDIKPHNNIY